MEDENSTSVRINLVIARNNVSLSLRVFTYLLDFSLYLHPPLGCDGFLCVSILVSPSVSATRIQEHVIYQKYWHFNTGSSLVAGVHLVRIPLSRGTLLKGQQEASRPCLCPVADMAKCVAYNRRVNPRKIRMERRYSTSEYRRVSIYFFSAFLRCC